MISNETCHVSQVKPSASIGKLVDDCASLKNFGAPPPTTTTTTTTSTTAPGLPLQFQLNQQQQQQQANNLARLIEKLVIIHKDENGFGLRIKGQSPVFIEHVHENGAAWRAGVRALDTICKVNGVPVSQLDHKEVVLLFKSCSRFVALTLVGGHLDQLIRGCGEFYAWPTGAPPARQGSLFGSNMFQSARNCEQIVAKNSPNIHSRRMSSSGVVMQHYHHPQQQQQQSIGQVPALMDRTNSCRSIGGASLFASQQQQLQKQLLDRQNSAGEEAQGDQTTTTTRDAKSMWSSPADKRMAVCICCRNSIVVSKCADYSSASANVITCFECQLKYRTNHELAYRQLVSATHRGAQLHSSLRETLARHHHHHQHHHQSNSPARGSKIVLVSPIDEHKQAFASAAAAAAAAREPKARGQKSAPPKRSSPPIARQHEQQVRAPAVVNKRLEIIREFIDTERTHTERLRCLNELFYRPLKSAGFVTSEQLRMIFSSHRTLYKIHKQIYKILMSANYDVCSQEPLVGSALLEIFEGDLKRRLERASCSFCAAQATNTELLNKLTRRDTKAGEFLAQITSQRMVGRLGVKDLLASCFQRLTKYPLLLENLLRATPETPPQGYDDDGDNNNNNNNNNNSETDGEDVSINGNRGDNFDGVVSRGATTTMGHRRRSKSDGLSARQPCLRMRAGLSPETAFSRETLDNPGNTKQNDDDDDEEENDEDAEEEDEEEEGDEDEKDEGNEDEDDEDDGERTEEEEDARQARLCAAEEARINSRRMMAISLAEEREFIGRALVQSRSILVRVNESIRVAIARNRLKEIWKRTDKYPGVPLIDITKQQVVHEGPLTLRLSKRSFDVYVLILNDYIIILTREGQDKYRLKFFTPDGKSGVSSALSSGSSSTVGSFITSGSGNNNSNNTSGNLNNSNNSNNNNNTGTCNSNSSSTTSGNMNSSNSTASANGLVVSAAPAAANNHNSLTSTPHQTVYSPVFVIDEHLTTRDAATDENGFYLLCKRKDDSRIYEFASRSPAERMKWRDKIQWTIERQMGKSLNSVDSRRACESALTKSSSEISANNGATAAAAASATQQQKDNNDITRDGPVTSGNSHQTGTGNNEYQSTTSSDAARPRPNLSQPSRPSTPSSSEPTKIVGTISYVIDDGIVPASKMESSRVLVDQAIQVNILDGSTTIKQTPALVGPTR